MDNITVLVNPNTSNGSAWYPLILNTATDYSTTFPLNAGNNSAYGIVSKTTTNCTSVAPLHDPLAPGTACNIRAGNYTFFRPLDSAISAVSLGPVYLWNVGNDTYPNASHLTALPCSVTMPPGYLCNGATPTYNGEQLGFISNGGGFTVYGSGCTGLNQPPSFSLCRYDTMYLVQTDNTTLTQFTTLSGAAIPCLQNLPNGFICESNKTSYSSNGSIIQPWIYYPNNTAPDNSTVECIQNSATVAPKCVQVDIVYTNGTNVSLIADGVHLKFYINGLRKDLTCTAPALTSTSESATVAMVADYYHVAVDQTPPPTLEDRVARVRARIRQTLRSPMTMMSNTITVANVTLYPKQSFVCCLSRTINALGQVVVALVFEVLETIRSLLSLPSLIPSYKFEVPTFREALTDAQNAVCEFACLLTRIIPAEYRCDELGTRIGCNSGPSCATSLLCHIFQAPLALVGIIVSLLESIKAIVGGGTVSTPALGDECGPNNVADCFASFIVYVIVTVVFTLTAILRDLAANLDCLICAITKAANKATPCVDGVYAVVAPITYLIEDIVKNVLSLIIKFIISVISIFVYLLSGDTTRFASELGHAFALLGEIIVNLAAAIWKFLQQIPFLGPILKVVNTIVSGACNFLQDVINAFITDKSKKVDFSCPAASKKRGFSGLSQVTTPGWIPLFEPEVHAAFSPVCTATVARYNTTAPDTEEEHYELAWCIFSNYWTVDIPAQNDLNGGSASTCDYRMPRMYTKSAGDWTRLSDEEQAYAMSCLRARAASETLRSTMPFVPRDIIDNIWRIPDFAEQMTFSYSTYQQYHQDRLLPLSSVLSAENTANWQSVGMSTVHLDVLRTMSTTDAQAALDAADDETLPELTVAAYAQRAVDSDAMSDQSFWGGRGRRRDPEQIAHAMRFYDAWFGNLTSLPSKKRALQQEQNTGNLFANVALQFVNFSIDRMAAYKPLPPPAFNLSEMTSNTSRRIPYIYIGLTGLLKDAPSIVAVVYKRLRDESIVSKSFVAGQSVATLMYAGTMASIGVVRDLFTGAMYQADVASATTFGLPPTIWKSHYSNTSTTIGGFFARASSALSAGVTYSMAQLGNGPQALAALVTKLSTRSLAAQVRRDRIKVLWTATTISFSRAWIKGRQVELTPEEHAMLYTVTPLPTGGVSRMTVNPALCLTNLTEFPGLCQNCLYLDNALGRLINGIQVPMIYYTGNATQEPSLAFSVVQYQAMRTYLFNRTSPALLGDRDDNPARYPWFDRSNWGIVGDKTPNKLRFHDIAVLWQQTYDLLVNGGTITGPFGVTVPPTVVSDSVPLEGATINGMFEVAARKVLQMTGNALRAVTNNTMEVDIQTLPSPAALFEAWGLFLYEWISFCSFNIELDGSHKRFSIGEMLLIEAAIALVFGVVMGAVFPGQMATVVPVVSLSIGMILFLGTLVISYSWSLVCGLALPQQLGDDVSFFSYRTLFPRAVYALNGPIRNTTYNSDTAPICANYAAVGGWDYANCAYEIGFRDFGFNIGFWLQTLSPSTLQWLNSTNTIILGSLMQLPFVQRRVNAFTTVYNASDPVSFSTYNSCAYTYTSWSNYLILQFVLRVLALLLPFVRLGLETVMALAILALAALFLIYGLSKLLFQIPIAVAQAQAQAVLDTTSLKHIEAHQEPLGARLLRFGLKQWATRQRRMLRLY